MDLDEYIELLNKSDYNNDVSNSILAAANALGISPKQLLRKFRVRNKKKPRKPKVKR